MKNYVDKDKLQEYTTKLTARYKKDSSYYDEVVSYTQRYYDSDCYFIEIPVTDNNGNIIKPYVGYDATKSPLEYAQANGTTLTTNNCISMKIADGTSSKRGNIIGAGNVLFSQNITEELLPNKVGYLTISEDRQTIKTFPINTTLATLQADSEVWNCMTYYYPLVENGVAVDNSDTICNEAGVATEKHPRLAIGVKSDKSLIIIACDARTEINAGLTSDELSALCIEKGCVNAWNLDGGGSTSVNIMGAKLNRNIDNDGTEDRNIHFTFNVKKPTAISGITDIFAHIGEEKQKIIQQIIPLVNSISNKFTVVLNENLNDIDYTSMLYTIHATNYPGTSDNGYCVTIVNSDRLYRFQIFTDAYENSNIYFRNYVNGTWGEWSLIIAYPLTGGHIQLTSSHLCGTAIGGNIYFSWPVKLPSGQTLSARWTTASGSGIIIRQNGQYLAGTGSSTTIKPTIGQCVENDTLIRIRLDVGNDLINDVNYTADDIVALQINGLYVSW